MILFSMMFYLKYKDYGLLSLVVAESQTRFVFTHDWEIELFIISLFMNTFFRFVHPFIGIFTHVMLGTWYDVILLGFQPF